MYNPRTIYLISIIVLIITSYFSIGGYHPDEYFQILEFAGVKLGITPHNQLAWEYYAQMRPAIQPLLVVWLYEFLNFWGVNNPFTIVFLLRLLSGLLAFISMWLLYQAYNKKFNDVIIKNWFLITSFFLWFVVFNGVRFSSENWSGIFFTSAFGGFFLNKKPSKVFYLVIGLGLGLSFICRYQAGFLIGGFILWMILIKKEDFYGVFLLLLGVVLVFFLGVLIDTWFYGEWVFTTWNYFDQNILQDKVSSFGLSPWWWYVKDFLFGGGVPPFTLVIIFSFIVYFVFRPQSPITWSVLPFLVIHFLIGHKETRFLLPIANFVPVVFISLFDWVNKKHIPNFSNRIYVKIFMKLFFIINFMYLIAIAVKPANLRVLLYEYVYYNYKSPTSLYTFKENPYYTATDIHFYKRKNLIVKATNSVDEVEHYLTKGSLLVFKKQDILPDSKKYELVYSSLPSWVLKLNFNNWVEKSPIFFVYKLKENP